MTRITPRTCLYPLAGSILLTFGLSIGLTFRSDHHCYAGTCGEWLFPLQARLHVVIWYSWLLMSMVFFTVRAFQPQLRRCLQRQSFNYKIPLVGERFAISALLGFFWVSSLYGIIIGVWWIRLRDYFDVRGQENGIFNGNGRLAAVALTGHLCDVTMGMVLIPVSRHSALASFFKLSVSTTLKFHMLTAYTLFTLVLIHGFLYVSWVAVFNSLSERLRTVFPVLNPTYLYYETWPGNSSALGIWRASLIFTGIASTTIMGLIFVTTLPKIRVKHFNLFYYTHLLSILAVIIICLHASTVFYCVAPGLAMWVLDWGMRLYELRDCMPGKVVHLGKGWYCIDMLLPRNRIDGCACKSPVAHFYIRHSMTSARELHPFTTITPLASQKNITSESRNDIPIQFLFRKRGNPDSFPGPQVRNPKRPSRLSFFYKSTKQTVQWTDKLAGLTDRYKPLSGHGENSSSNSQRTSTPLIEPASKSLVRTCSSQGVDISVRLEGPYFSEADPSPYRTVICFVAGTGVSGAIAIARDFLERRRQQAAPITNFRELGSERGTKAAPVWEKCVVFWSVKATDYIDLPFLKADPTASLEVNVHLTGEGRSRLNFEESLASICRETSNGSNWVYMSGPIPFIRSGEKACEANPSVEWYSAKWDI